MQPEAMFAWAGECLGLVRVCVPLQAFYILLINQLF